MSQTLASTDDPGAAQPLRRELAEALRVPMDRDAPAAEHRGQFEHDGVIVERWIWESEAGSWVTGAVYRPRQFAGPAPAVLVANGNGESKSTLAQRYAGQLYAKLGLVCLVYDTIGEEERNPQGELGTREHNRKHVIDAVAAADRPMMGKMVLDAMRGLDLLLTRSDVDPQRLGVVGNSMGGATASWLLALDTRLRAAIVCGWAFDDLLQTTGKSNTRVADRLLRQRCTWDQFLALAAPHCATLIMNGDADPIIDARGDGGVWRSTQEAVDRARPVFASYGHSDWIQTWWARQSGHRPYYLHPDAVPWLNEHLGTPGWSRQQLQALPTVTLAAWCARHNIDWYSGYRELYWTDLHVRQTLCADLEIRPFPIEMLRCLRPQERHDPRYSMAGWLEAIRTTRVFLTE